MACNWAVLNHSQNQLINEAKEGGLDNACHYHDGFDGGFLSLYVRVLREKCLKIDNNI